MFTPQAIGFVDNPYKDTAAIPKGLGAKHDAEGVLRILPEFELGLTDIEGFSHLMVIWAFDRSHVCDRAVRCSVHTSGILPTHFSSERSGICFPSRIASVISGAKKAKGMILLM
jgi:tRNA (Thr-GGU) A37 N-methylase